MNAARARVVTVAVSGILGCGAPMHRTVLSTKDAAEYPCVLADPVTLPENFMVRQNLSIVAQREGKPVEGQFDAVLQKQGGDLLIVGFGPMNVKAFTIRHRGDRIEFEQFLGPPLVFSPRNVVVDVHRVFFKHLPAPTTASYSGVVRGELDGEHVEETWADGELRARVFTRPEAPGRAGGGPGAARRGAIRIELGPGCTPSQCEPETVTLHNEWFSYTLTIVNDGYEKL